MLMPADIKRARTSIFFGSLPDIVFDEIMQKSRVVQLGVGDALFHQGEPAGAIFAVLDGLVKLTVDQRDGSEVVVETFGAGASFAEALAFGQSPYPVSGFALVDSRVLVAPSRAVKTVVQDNPDSFGAILAATYAHMHQLVRQIEQLKSKSGLERLGRYILARADIAGSTKAIEIPIEKKVLASLLGMKPETLSRAFRRLRDHGVVVEGPVIQLKDRAALQRLIDVE